MSDELTRSNQNQLVTVTGPLVAAIESTWSAIQHRHPEVPHVVLTLGNGTSRAGRSAGLVRAKDASR
jgi:hypothetical protein